MNFKDHYQMENNEVHPEPEFLEQLAFQMKREKIKVRRRKQMLASAGAVAAAAAICVIALHGNNLLKLQDGKELNQMADAATDERADQTISQSDWQEQSASETEAFEVLQELLNEDEIETLYCAKEAEWDEEDILSQSETEDLQEELKDAQEVKASVSGECFYYMAVFKSGKIIKFEIYEGQYLRLKDADTVYAF